MLGVRILGNEEIIVTESPEPGLIETRVLIQIKASKMRNYVKNRRFSIIVLLLITLSNCSQGNNPFYYRLSPGVSDNGLPDRKRRSKIC